MGDSVNHPSHYNAYEGLEVIDLVEQMNFNRGNAVKYITRAGFKSNDTEIQDLKKAAWYINREIERLTRGSRVISTTTKLAERCPACGAFWSKLNVDFSIRLDIDMVICCICKVDFPYKSVIVG